MLLCVEVCSRHGQDVCAPVCAGVQLNSCWWRTEVVISCLPLTLSTLVFGTGSLTLELSIVARLAG